MAERCNKSARWFGRGGFRLCDSCATEYPWLKDSSMRAFVGVGGRCDRPIDGLGARRHPRGGRVPKSERWRGNPNELSATSKLALGVGSKKQLLSVRDYAEASDHYRTFVRSEEREGRGGASKTPEGFIYNLGLSSSGVPVRVARISYNGCVWSLRKWKSGDEPLFDPAVARKNPILPAALLSMLSGDRGRRRALSKARTAIHARVDAEAALRSIHRSRDMRRLLGRRSAIVRCPKCWQMTTVILGERVAGDHLHVKPGCPGELHFVDVGDPPKFRVKD